MKRFSGRLVSAALALALASSPAFAGRYHHHDHYRGGSASGWWIGGAVALAAAGLYLAANSGRATRRPASTRPAWPPARRFMPRRSIRRLSMPRPRRLRARARNSTRRCSINSRVRRQCAGQRVHRLPALGRQPERLRPGHHLAMDHAGHGGLLQPRAGFLHEQPRLPRQLTSRPGGRHQRRLAARPTTRRRNSSAGTIHTKPLSV